MNTRLQVDQIMALAQDFLAPHGWHILDCRWEGSERRLQFFLEKNGQTPTLDSLAQASRLIDEVSEQWVDVVGLGSDSYILEVSSPGIDRPLRRLEDLRAAAGRKVRARVGTASASFEGVLGGSLVDEVQGDEIVLKGAGGRPLWQGNLGDLESIDLL